MPIRPGTTGRKIGPWSWGGTSDGRPPKDGRRGNAASGAMEGRGWNMTTEAPVKKGLNTMSAGDRADRRQASIKAQQEKYIASTKEPGAKWSWSDFAKKASRWQKMSEIAEKGRERG